ncbi:MAG: tyrosine recombinase [Thermomicrobiales bacterium]
MQDVVERFLGELASERGFSNNTISAYGNDLRQFAGFMQDSRRIPSWSVLGNEDVKAFEVHLRERGYAASTVARKTAATRTFCGYLVDQQIVRSDPSAEMTTPKVAKSIPRALTREEIDRLLAQPEIIDGEEMTRDVAMLRLLYATGIRVSELVSLDIEDVRLDDVTGVMAGRRGRKRLVPIGPAVVESIRTYLRTREPVDQADGEPVPALFLNHRGKRLTRQGFWLILKTYAERAGFEDITPHTLRHSFAAHQILDGRDLSDVQELLGHVSISTTQVYEDLADELRKVAADESLQESSSILVQ